MDRLTFSGGSEEHLVWQIRALSTRLSTLYFGNAFGPLTYEMRALQKRRCSKKRADFEK